MPDRAGSECGKCCCAALTGGRAEYLRHCTAECRSGGHDSARRSAAGLPRGLLDRLPVPRCSSRNQAINPNTWITRTNPVGVVGRSKQHDPRAVDQLRPSSISASTISSGGPRGSHDKHKSIAGNHTQDHNTTRHHAHLRLLLAFLLLHHGCFTCFCFVVSCSWGQQQKMRIVMEEHRKHPGVPFSPQKPTISCTCEAPPPGGR